MIVASWFRIFFSKNSMKKFCNNKEVLTGVAEEAWKRTYCDNFGRNKLLYIHYITSPYQQ